MVGYLGEEQGRRPGRERGPRLRCGGIVEDVDIGVQTLPGQARLAGCSQALTNLPLLQVGREGQAPIPQGPRRAGIVREQRVS